MYPAPQPGRPARPPERLTPNPKLRFLDQCREVLRFKQMAQRTEESYVHWIRRFIVWSGKRHPRDMGAALLDRDRYAGKPVMRTARPVLGVFHA